MDIVTGIGAAGRMRIRRCLLAASAALAVSGCVNPAFRESVGQFGAVTKAAATAQSERLTAVTALEQERIRSELVASNVELRIDPACAQRLGQERIASTAADAAAPPPPPCILVARGHGPIEQPQRFEHVIALNAALADYSDSLIALAADASEDEAAFTSSVAALATSLGGLETAIRSAAGEDSPQASERLGPIAALFAELGNLYFAHERNRVLKRIIRQADPLVQDAVRLLGEADSRLRFNERARLAAQLDDAETAVADAHGDGAGALRAAHDDLFAALDAYNLHGAGLRNYVEIGEAHRKLRLAAEAGASAAELRAAIEAIIHLAGTAHQAVTPSTNQTNGSSNDGN